MFEFEGTTYNLKYSLKRVEIVENVIKKPLFQVLQQGAVSITELSVLFAYALIKEGADAYVPPKTGLSIVDKMFEEPGSYQDIQNLVAEALERDCPFFFPAG